MHIQGFNQQKEGVRSKIRLVKALELPLRKPQTILMGSSRVHDAMNPDHPLLQEYAPAYNLAVDMNRIYETLLLLRHATENANIKRLVLGIDFFMFNGLQRKNEDFDESLIGRKTNITDYLSSTLLSRTALIDSFKTIKQSHQQPDRLEFLPNGYRPQAFFGLKNYPAIHYYTNWIFLTPTGNGARYYAQMTLNEQVFSDFDQLLALCKTKGIDVHLYVNPAHAHLDGEGIRALGKWEMFENWKRRITTISASHHIPLWDFSGYSSVTTEKVSSPMSYYWDSSHFTEAVGGWILGRIFGQNIGIPPDFGVLLTLDNIEPHLQSIRDSRDKYIAENRQEVLSLIADYKEIIGGAPLDQSRMKDMF